MEDGKKDGLAVLLGLVCSACHLGPMNPILPVCG